jgi:signal transduction histidine kinase
MFSRLPQCFAGLSLVLAALATAAVPLTPAETRRALLDDEISVLRDPGGRLGIGDIASADRQSQFKPTRHPGSLGFTQDAVWLRIVLQRSPQAPSDWRLELASWTLNDVQFFAPEGQFFHRSQAGDTYPFAERELEYRAPVFRVSLPDTLPHTFYLRLQSDSTLSSTLILWETSAFRVAAQRDLVLIGAVLGLIAMVVLLGFVDWLVNRERVQLALAGLNVLVLAVVVGYSGLVNQYLFPHSPRWGDAWPPTAFTLFAASVIVVFRHVLEVRKMSRWLDRLLVCFALLHITVPVTRWLGWPGIDSAALNFMFLVGVVINMAATLVRWRHRREGAGLFVVAFGSFTLGVAVLMITSFGALPGLTVFREASLFGACMAFSFIALLAVLNEVRVARSERERARYEAATGRAVALQEQRLREEQTVFFSFVAHELRTPLGVVRAAMGNLERDLVDAGTHIKDRLQRVRRATERMSEMIERHLHLQRLSRADFEISRQPVAPAAPAETALAMAREGFPRREFELVKADSLPPSVPIDAELVALALLNLLSNAAKYSPPETAIALAVDLHPQWLFYSVRDLGDGIPESERERVFQMFWRAPGAGAQAGFGVGLPMARRIAQLHGGSLDYDVSESAGTRFVLSLPVLAAEAGS